MIDCQQRKHSENLLEIPIDDASATDRLVRIELYLKIISFEHWNCSPMWWTDKPVTQAYKNIVSCSSDETFLVALYPAFCSLAMRILKKGL